MYRAVERIATKNGVDMDKAKNYGIGNKRDISAWNIAVSS